MISPILILRVLCTV